MPGSAEPLDVSVGVAIATFNSERHLAAQLESVFSQDAPIDGIVIADDGSTDATRALIEEVAGPHAAHVMVLHGRVGGVVPNFERALTAVDADVVFLCDHDDVWEAGKVRATLSLVAPGTLQMLFSDATLINDSGVATGDTLFASLRISRREMRLVRERRAIEVLVRRNIVTGATAAVTRELINAALPVPDEWLHDEWFAALAACLGSLTLVEGRPTRYRQHSSNMVGVGSPSARARIMRMLQSPPDRHHRLARRFTHLHDAATRLEAPTDVIELIGRKVQFEQARRNYSRSRLRRLLPVARQLFAGNYARYASQRRLDALRDLVVR